MSKRSPTRTEGDQFVGSGGFQDDFQGTAAMYVIEPDGHAELFLGDYDIDALAETWKDQLRAVRQCRKHEGKAVPRLPTASLQDRVLIAFGPQISAKQAVAALERAIQSITDEGLLIGRDRKGNLAWEQVKSKAKV